jgi:hypothetical protein
MNEILEQHDCKGAPMTITDAHVRGASAALDRLVLDKVIDAVTLRFTGTRFTGTRVVIYVRTKAQDELSAARVRRQVQTVLEPFLQDALIVVEPGGTKTVDEER